MATPHGTDPRDGPGLPSTPPGTGNRPAPAGFMAYLEHTMMSQTPGTSMHMQTPLAASGVTFRRPRGNFVSSDEYSAASIFQTAPARTPSYQVPQ